MEYNITKKSSSITLHLNILQILFFIWDNIVSVPWIVTGFGDDSINFSLIIDIENEKNLNKYIIIY